jgi:hypothetical protein
MAEITSDIQRTLFPRNDPPQSTTAAEKPKPAPFASVEAAYANLPAGTAGVAQARAAAIAAKTDAFFDAADAPYAIATASGEKSVAYAPPQFRMVGGYNDGNAKKLSAALSPASPKLQAAIGHVVAGRGTPEEVRMVTQALIDRGKLGPVTPGHEKEAIQALQWNYGVGMDCAGYVQRAFFAARGKVGTPEERKALGMNAMAVNFASLPTNPKWKSVPIASARAGDVLLLDPPKNEKVGHVVLVRKNELVDAKKLGVPESTFQGPVRCLEVDSSWGAGELGKNGGVKRCTWLYDEGSGKWATFDPATKSVSWSNENGPYDHPLKGIYRPKSEP